MSTLRNIQSSPSSNFKVGIVGNGFVGKATSCFGNSQTLVYVYDKNPQSCNPPGTTLDDIYSCDMVFVSVPTPMNEDGSCHTNIVEQVVTDLQQHGVKDIIIRSTVPIGTSQKLGVHFMPEFLTEKNWEKDFYTCPKWIIGIDNDDPEFIMKISCIIGIAKIEDKIESGQILFTSTKEAEAVKYFRNCFLATKVSFFNEMNSLCEKMGLKYIPNIRDGVIADERVGDSHTLVPHEEYHNGSVSLKKGFGGTCFWKDCNALQKTFAGEDVPSPILDAVLFRNAKIDRPEQDWLTDVGRVVVPTTTSKTS